MSEIYRWFNYCGQSPPFNFERWYISEHAQKPLGILGEDEAFRFMQLISGQWFLTKNFKKNTNLKIKRESK